MPSKTIHVFSDFDNTIVSANVAGLLVRYYIAKNPHHEPLHRRLKRGMNLLIPSSREKHFPVYYECLRRIPAKEIHHLLRDVHLNYRWLRAVKDIRMRHKAKNVRVTIITRNAIDVVNDWVMQNQGELRKHHVVVEGIIANGPSKQKQMVVVRQGAGLKHINYIGFGQLREREKQDFVDKNSLYIGDGEDEVLRSLVKEFVRV